VDRGGTYVEHRIATSDDLQDADGVAVLNFGQAQHAAREWWRTELRREASTKYAIIVAGVSAW
jgi:hypothetical protein